MILKRSSGPPTSWWLSTWMPLSKHVVVGLIFLNMRLMPEELAERTARAVPQPGPRTAYMPRRLPLTTTRATLAATELGGARLLHRGKNVFWVPLEARLAAPA